MNKKTKILMLLSSAAILLPIIPGMILWDRLPMGVMHSQSGIWERLLLVVGIPVIMLGIFLMFAFITVKDPQNKEQNSKILGLAFAIIPLISYYCYVIMFLILMGKGIDISSLSCIFFGILLLIVGNYMPKCKQNRYIGIKIKWTLSNKENWAATHRLAGKVWVLGAFPIIACALLDDFWAMAVMMTVLIALLLIPVVYSYVFYRKQIKNGTYESSEIRAGKHEKPILIVTLAVVVLALVMCVYVMFVGDVEISYFDDSFTVDAQMVSATTVEYEKIESIELRENFDKGSRIFGVGSTRLCAGTFTCDELGSYSLYSYTGCDSAVILKIDGKYLVINGSDESATVEIYEKLSELCKN